MKIINNDLYFNKLSRVLKCFLSKTKKEKDSYRKKKASTHNFSQIKSMLVYITKRKTIEFAAYKVIRILRLLFIQYSTLV